MIYLTMLIIFLLGLTMLSLPNVNPRISNSKTLNRRQLKTTQPLFARSLYVYLLGLFVKQENSGIKHSPTSAEPTMFQVAILLSREYNITANGKQFAYRLADTTGEDMMETLDHTCNAILENQVLGIVGPEYSIEAKTLSWFANRAGLPVVGYSTTDPALSNRNEYKTFYRLPPSDFITARVLLKLYQKYQWNSTNVIYQSDNYGESGLEALTEVFDSRIVISRAIKYDLYTGQIDRFQHQLVESSSRIVLVWANVKATMNIIELALEIENIMAPSFLWILIAHNAATEIEYYANTTQLSGMFILRLTKPNIINAFKDIKLLQDAMTLWKRHYPQSYPNDETKIDIFALYAFDAAWLLILAIEKLCQQYPNSCLSFRNTSDCFVSQLVRHNELHQIIQTINFTGLTGYVQFQPNTTDRINSAIVHYAVDNLQRHSANVNQLQVIEVLKFNGNEISLERESACQWTETQSTIQWPSKASESHKHYARLKNQVLDITVYESAPFFMMQLDRNNLSQPSGYIPELLVELQKRMEFNYSYFVAPSKITYDELVDCVENQTYHIVMADLTITSNRADKIAFSYPIYDNTLRLVIRKDQKLSISTFALFKPFSVGLWLLVAGVVYLGSSILIAIYEYYETPDKNEKDEQNVNIFNKNWAIIILRSLYHTIGALLQRGADLQPRTFFGCLQTVVVWIMSIILISLLTSNLIVYFTAQVEKPWLQSIEELQMCRKVACNRIGIVERSQHEEYFTKEVMNGIQLNYYHLKHPHDAYTKLLQHHIDVAVSDSSSADYFTQRPEFCQLGTTGIPFGRSYFGIGFSKEWPYKEDLDKHIMELKINGEIDRLQAKWFEQKNCDRINTDNPDAVCRVTVQEASGLFIIFGIITVLNLLAFIVKRIFCPENHVSSQRYRF